MNKSNFTIWQDSGRIDFEIVWFVAVLRVRGCCEATRFPVGSLLFRHHDERKVVLGMDSLSVGVQ